MKPKKLMRGILVGLAIFLVTFILNILQVFESWELKTWDLRQRSLADPNRADPEVVIILIDQNSLDLYAEQSQFWPWMRQMYIPIIQFCQNGGARAVFFDFLYSEDSVYGVDDDRLFAQAMAEAGNVFLPVQFSRTEAGIDPGRLDQLNNHAVERPGVPAVGIQIMKSAVAPLGIYLESCRGIGNVQIEPDQDGIFRRIPLYFSLEDQVFSVLPLALAEFRQGTPLTSIPLDRSGRMIIKFHGPSGTYPTYSAAAIINSFVQLQTGIKPQIDPDSFKDKIVMVGGSAPGLLEFRPSPTDHIFAGTEVHAAALDTLLNRNWFRVPGLPAYAFFLVLLVLLTTVGAVLIQKTWQVALFGFGCVVLAAAASWIAFSKGIWLEFVASEFAVTLGFTVSMILNYSVEGRQRRFIKSAFHHYLSPHVIEQVLDNPSLLKLGGEQREISSFFSDVAGFTSISEGLSPENLVSLLNDYLTEMTDLILDTGGTLDKYEGDAIIAFWNAPVDQPDHALRACRAALGCQQRLVELRPRFLESCGKEFRMRIGVNSGPAVVGNMGSHRRFDYTAMGDTINLASRLEGACKHYGIEILVGETTYELIKQEIAAREIDLIRVVGKSRPVRVFQLLGEKGHLASEEESILETFGKGLELYRARRWDEADAFFSRLGDDGPSKSYRIRIQALKADPPPDHWEGVFDLMSK